MRSRPLALTFAVAASLAVLSWSVAHASIPDASVRETPEWSTPLDDPPWGLAADNDGAVVTTQETGVYLLDPQGGITWRTHVGSVTLGTPALDRDTVLVGGDHLVTALARRSGKQWWQYPAATPVTSLALGGGIAVVGDQEGTLTAYDERTGARRWSDHFDGRLWSGARVDVASSTVVAAWHSSPEAAVRALDLATGKLRWAQSIGVQTAAPLITRDEVVIASGDGNYHAGIAAFDLARGTPRWFDKVPASFEEAIEPAARGSDVVVVDHFGRVMMFDAATGKVRWQRATGYPLIETQMAITSNRVTLHTFSGDLFVLDRAAGRTVEHLDPKALKGYVLDTAVTSRRGRVCLLVALRLAAPYRVECRLLR
jgi:outer membrane protein assembly factor BamB